MRVLSEVTNISVALARRVHEEISSFGVEYRRGDDLVKLVHFRRLDIDHIEYIEGSVHIPQVDSQVVGGDEVVAVAGERERVDVNVVVLPVGVLPLVLRSGVLSCIYSLWDFEVFGVCDCREQFALLVAVVALSRALTFLVYSPELDGLVVGRQHEQILGALIDPLGGIDVLIDFDTLQVVEFSLMTLELRVVVEVVGAGRPLKYNKATPSISYA